MVADLEVHAINLRARLAVLGDGTISQIVILMDDSGTETEIEDDAVVFVAKAKGLWFTGKVSTFRRYDLN